MNGFAKIHRQIYDHPLFKDSPILRQIFQELFVMAKYRDGEECWNGKTYRVARGQIMISVRELAKLTARTVQQVRTAQHTLQHNGCIAINTAGNNRPAIITICNYDKFQAFAEQHNNDGNTALTQPSTTHQHTVKEKKEINKNNTHASARESNQLDLENAISAKQQMANALTCNHVQPEVTMQNDTILLTGNTHQKWLAEFGGDAEQLRLALLQIAAWVQPNGYKPLQTQVASQLAKIVGNRNYYSKLNQKRPAAFTSQEDPFSSVSAYKRYKEGAGRYA